MQLKYRLKETDLVFLSEYEIEQSDSIRRRRRLQRIRYVIALSLFAVVAYRISRSPGLPILFGALAVVSFLFYPRYVRWVTRRNITKIGRERSKPDTYADRVLSATADGLQQSTGYAESRIDWSHVGAIEDLPDYVVVMIQNVPLIGIPKEGVVEGDISLFVEQVKKYTEDAAGRAVDGGGTT